MMCLRIVDFSLIGLSLVFSWCFFHSVFLMVMMLMMMVMTLQLLNLAYFENLWHSVAVFEDLRKQQNIWWEGVPAEASIATEGMAHFVTSNSRIFCDVSDILTNPDHLWCSEVFKGVQLFSTSFTLFVHFFRPMAIVYHHFRKAFYEMRFHSHRESRVLFLKLAFISGNCGNVSHAGSQMMSCWVIL